MINRLLDTANIPIKVKLSIHNFSAHFATHFSFGFDNSLTPPLKNPYISVEQWTADKVLHPLLFQLTCLPTANLIKWLQGREKWEQSSIAEKQKVPSGIETAGLAGRPSYGMLQPLLLPFSVVLFSLTHTQKMNGNSSTMTQFCQKSHFLTLTSS